LLATVGVAIFVGIATTGDPNEPEAVASLDDLRERGVVFLEDEGIYLVYNDGDPLALDSDSQHVGDKVVFCESSQMFESPAHGEKFDIRGHYFGGPAAGGLDRYPVRLDGDGLFVAIHEPIAGPPRGSGRVSDPQGPFCIYD
jgi:Rieske Fe-S protein